MRAELDPEITLKLRPKLAQWMFERDLKPEHAAGPVGVSSEMIRRYCLPFGNPKRQVPRAHRIDRIVQWTNGAVQAADFYEPVADRVAEDVQ